MSGQRQGDGYQEPYGSVGISNWGEGYFESEYAVGDIVFVPPNCAAIRGGRVREPGLHRVVAQFSIGPDAAFYYRLSPVELGGKRGTKVITDYGETSDRCHVIWGDCDYTAGWFLVHSARASATDDGPPSSPKSSAGVPR